MSAEIVSFPALDGPSARPTAPRKFHCADDVVEHCLREIGLDCSKDLARRFVEEMEAVKHRMIPEWLLIEMANDPGWIWSRPNDPPAPRPPPPRDPVRPRCAQADGEED